MYVTIIIPAYNEQNHLPITLGALHNHRFWDEVIVVDDGSTDQTAYIELPDGVKMLKHSRNYGKGKAIETGVKNSKGDFILFLDADLGETVQWAEKLIDPILNGNADMVIAKFPQTYNGGFGIVKRFAKNGIRKLTGKELSEPLSGQRCIRKELTNEIMDYNMGFGFEVALTLDILRAGYNISEIELPFRHRELGRTWRGFYHRGKEMIHILRTFWLKR